jgi:hypothetical protein
MHDHPIFLPMAALALLTFVALILIPFRRIAAARRGEVRAVDFAFGESTNVPGSVSIPNRNYMNLLELPVLFYVICLLFDLSGGPGPLALALAWVYVALRVAHSLIHLTYNNVMHRLAAFATSNIVLGALWILFFGQRLGR